MNRKEILGVVGAVSMIPATLIGVYFADRLHEETKIYRSGGSYGLEATIDSIRIDKKGFKIVTFGLESGQSFEYKLPGSFEEFSEGDTVCALVDIKYSEKRPKIHQEGIIDVSFEESKRTYEYAVSQGYSDNDDHFRTLNLKLKGYGDKYCRH